jgi:hypothetical protein
MRFTRKTPVRSNPAQRIPKNKSQGPVKPSLSTDYSPDELRIITWLENSYLIKSAPKWIKEAVESQKLKR